MSRARTTPEEPHQYTRDEDWHALAHAWRKSADLGDMFNDSFTRYEMTARDERRVRESSEGRELIRRTWQILESFGITIEVPTTGRTGKRPEPFISPCPRRRGSSDDLNSASPTGAVRSPNLTRE